AELKKRHFAFLFAQNFHPSFKNVAKVRKELGVRTLFNLLGPFLNPSRPTHLLMGVGDPKHIPLVCETLIALKQPVAAVVCGAGIYDEVTPLGVADVTIIRQGQAQPLYLNPKDFGIKPCRPTELEVHSKREAVEVLRELLSGHGPAPMLDMIVLNVGLALYLLEETWNLAECMAYARDAVMKGVGQKVLYAG
ncbi:MAG: anthranilate phosphoribosyltransferase, partial [Desulfovibrionaceae bacterium]|nr:anthranilate phosphoribosyltransferase [Desulfovibrionaceae bacterium]